MPTILTRSAGSARGYGLTGNPTIYRVQQTLQSTTWTAPAGVTSLTTVTGKGQDGYATYWTELSPYPTGDGCLAWVWSANENNVTPAEVEGFAQSQWDLFPTGGSGDQAVVSWSTREYFTLSPPYYTQKDFTALVRVTFVGSGPKNKIGSGWGANWPPMSSGSLYYGVGRIEANTPQFDGANTTGFGYTFAGGVGAPATSTTYTNVPVTPGTTYTINSTGDGFITIIYYLQV